MPFIVGLSGPPVASGDELSDALARQKALAARIQTQREEAARLRAVQAGLASDMAATRTALSGINADLAATKKRVAALDGRIAAAKVTYQDLVANVASLDGQVASLEAEQAERARELVERKARLAARLREAYRADRTSLIETILSAQSFTDVLEDVGSYLDFGEQDRALAERIAADQETLAAVHSMLLDTRAATEELRNQALEARRALDARMSELKAARKQLAALQKETARQLAIQQATWAKMTRTASALKAALAADLAAQKRIKAQIADLVARQRSYGNIPSQFNGTLGWPLAGVITQEFGCTGFSWEPPLGGCAHFHAGIDIAAPKYTPIRAAGDGVVVFAGPNPYDAYPKAWIVVIAHSGNLQTWYAHLDNALKPIPVIAGETVRQGQVIGYVGMTGRTTGPHLHWMVEYNSDFVNPRLFV